MKKKILGSLIILGMIAGSSCSDATNTSEMFEYNVKYYNSKDSYIEFKKEKEVFFYSVSTEAIYNEKYAYFIDFPIYYSQDILYYSAVNSYQYASASFVKFCREESNFYYNCFKD